MKGSRAFPFFVSLLLVLGGCSGPPPAVTVRIDPNHARVHVGLSVQLTATVNNADNDAVTWQLGGSGCSGEACGRITSDGLFTAPATVPDPPQVTVSAVSVADPSKSAMALITVLPAVEITVTPADPTVGVGRSLKFTAAVQNADDPRVVWTVTGAGCTGSGCGTVSDTGLFSAPTLVPTVPTVTITAASVEDPAAIGSATALIVLSAQSVEWGWMAGPHIRRRLGRLRDDRPALAYRFTGGQAGLGGLDRSRRRPLALRRPRFCPERHRGIAERPVALRTGDRRMDLVDRLEYH